MDYAVFKFMVPQPDGNNQSIISIPRDAKVTSVGMQDDSMAVWALVPNPDHAKYFKKVTLIVVNTGVTFEINPDNFIFLGTTTSWSGIVWHIWVENH